MRRMKTQKSLQSISMHENAGMIPQEQAKFGLFSQFGNSLSIYWSFIIAVANFWTVFSVLFSAGTSAAPSGVPLVVEVVFETILFLEVIARLLLKRFFSKTYDNLKLTHKGLKDSYLLLVFLLIISFPGVTLCYIITNGDNSGLGISIVSYVMLLKLLRAFEIIRFHATLQEMLFFKEVRWIIFMKLAENLVLIFWIVHVLSCIWMISQNGYGRKISIFTMPNDLTFFLKIYLANDQNQFTKFDLYTASEFTQYVESMMFVISALSGCCFGDVNPMTYTETLLTITFLITGVTAYAKVFSDFNSLMRLFSEEKNLNQYAFNYIPLKLIY